MFYVLNVYTTYSNWYYALNWIANFSFSVIKTLSFEYKYISYLTSISLSKEYKDKNSFFFSIPKIDSKLVNGSSIVQFCTSLFDNNYFFSKSQSMIDSNNVLTFTFFFYLWEFRLCSDDNWFNNFNFIGMEILLSSNISVLLDVNESNTLQDHTLLYSNIYSIVDDYSFYGLEDYSLRVDSFIEYNMFQFLKLRYGFGSYLSKFYCSYMGFSKELSFKDLCNYWYYSLGGLYLDSKSRYMDNKLALFEKSRHLFLVRLNSRKGIRLLNGYPIYGQRTRSNAKTSSKFPYTLQFKTI